MFVFYLHFTLFQDASPSSNFVIHLKSPTEPIVAYLTNIDPATFPEKIDEIEEPDDVSTLYDA